ncbi:MAG: hypothetical protein KHY76_01260 [Butyricicoccus pullicaecorum]|jgi:hypothetical protein|nr:hypothetical protein [Butyricicoccus pullicaecorum]
MRHKKQKKKGTKRQSVLSIPNSLLQAAGIQPDTDLVIETIPGVILIGEEAPLSIVQQPFVDLFSAMGLTPKEVTDVMVKGGFTYE